MTVESKVKIFYADDDEDDRFVFTSAIIETNIPVALSCFVGGYDMEKKLDEIGYDCDLVFLDLNMPGKNGLETLNSLQVPIKLHQLKVIIFTTSADPKTIQRTHTGNAVLFVQKPDNFTALVDTLKDLIQSRRKLHLPVLLQDFKFNLSNGRTIYDS